MAVNVRKTFSLISDQKCRANPRDASAPHRVAAGAGRRHRVRSDTHASAGGTACRLSRSGRCRRPGDAGRVRCSNLVTPLLGLCPCEACRDAVGRCQRPVRGGRPDRTAAWWRRAPCGSGRWQPCPPPPRHTLVQPWGCRRGWPLPAAGSRPPLGRPWQQLRAVPVELLPVLPWDTPKPFSLRQLSHLSNCKTHAQARPAALPAIPHPPPRVPRLCRARGQTRRPGPAVTAACRVGLGRERADPGRRTRCASGGKASLATPAARAGFAVGAAWSRLLRCVLVSR